MGGNDNGTGCWGILPLSLGGLCILIGWLQASHASGLAITLFVIGAILVIIGAAMLGILGAILDFLGLT